METELRKIDLLSNIEDSIRFKYRNYLNKNKKNYIEFLNNENSNNLNFFETKLDYYYDEINKLSINKLHISLLELYIESKLSGKGNAKIIISNISLTPLVFDGNNNLKRGIIAKVAYKYNN